MCAVARQVSGGHKARVFFRQRFHETGISRPCWLGKCDRILIPVITTVELTAVAASLKCDRPSEGADDQTTPLFTPVLIIGCAILLISFAIRSAFGVFQIPIADEFGWLRSEFSTAIAIQNLAWGIGQPIFGAIAEKIGDRKAIVIGAIMYAMGWCCRPMR